MIGGRSAVDEDAGRGRAHVRDRVHRPVRGVRGRERPEVLERDRERRARRRAARRRAPAPANRSAAGPTPARRRWCSTSSRVKRTTSAPSLVPTIVVRCAAIVPAGELAGGDRRRVARRRDLAGARPVVDRPARGLGEHAERRPELAEEVRRRGSGRTTSTGCPNPICSKSRCGESRCDRFGELVDLDRVDAALQRQQRERQRVGDEARAAAGRVDRRAAACARVEHAGAPLVAEPVGRRANSSPRVVTTFVPDSSSATTSSRSKRARHVQHAVGAERADRGPVVGRGDADRLLAAQHARVDAVLRGVVDEHADELERRDAGSPRATRGARCCPSPTGRRGSGGSLNRPARRTS